ncbi:MAG: glycosyltransferase family 2 protein [Candidatus Yanofskybacteria bacterium]|nr:glycosyltransferase family 2 protein [Candidatus Yanofskybacteria bacterium]
MKISIIIPVYNEAENLPKLFGEIERVMAQEKLEYEIIAVNDGSRDGSETILKNLAQDNKNIKLINFALNFGQTAALSAGISHAQGEVIVPIDADLENHPEDIPRLLAKLAEGHDVVSGWRKNRWNNQRISRKFPSTVANKLISLLTGTHLHDYGCTLKAYKKEIMGDLQLYGEMHRFIPAYAAWNGARVSELEVSYSPRQHGKSKYGFSRTFRVILDLILIRFFSHYMTRPIHFFGGLGIASVTLGTLAGLIALGLRLFAHIHLVQTPLPVFSAFLVIVGVQFTMMGILAEMLMRTYYESQHKTPYTIKERINF